MRKSIISLSVFLFLGAATPHAATTELSSSYRLMDAYALTASDRYQHAARLFMDLCYAFCVDTGDSSPVPPHVVRTDSSFYRSLPGIEDWKDYCGNIIQALYKQEKKRSVVRPVAGRLYDVTDQLRFLKAAENNGITITKLPWYNLADSLWSDTARTLADAKIAAVATQITNLVVDENDQQARKIAAALLDTVRVVKSLYQRKYRTGYRNRNILEYFIAGSFETFVAKKQRQLLSPPSPFELILLSKPMMTAGTGSLYDGGSDSNNIYVLIPFAGADRFTSNYKQYFGASVFSAVPLGAKPYHNAYWGVEAHFSNKALIGYGWKIPDFSTQKLFMTIPLVSGWGWFD